MKTDLLFPRKAYIGMLTMLLALITTSGVFGQCIIDCPSPSVITVIDGNDGTEDCLGTIMNYALVVDNCTSANSINVTSLDPSIVLCPSGVSTNCFAITNNDTDAAGGDNEVTVSFLNLPLGIYDFEIRTNEIPAQSCFITLVVQETYNLACNDDINLSLDLNCEARVLTDMILEGEVACFTDYTLEIDGFAPSTYEVMVDAPGTYGVTVTSPSGQSCWSTITVEDKLSQPLFCSDVTVPCSQDHSPGTPIIDFKEFEGPGDAEVSTESISNNNGDPGSSSHVATAVTINDNGTPADPSDDFEMIDTLCVNFDLSGCAFTDQVMDIELSLEVWADDVNQIEAYFVAPNATTAADTIQVLDLISGNGCTDANFDINLSDAAFFPHSAFGSPIYCGSGPVTGPGYSYAGSFQPATPLSAFNGRSAQGVWKLVILNRSQINNMTVASEGMSLTVSGNTISYPLPGATFTPTGNPNEYDVTIANNNCGPYVATYTDSGFDMCDGFTRTWVLENGVGLTASCDQEFTFSSPAITFPPDYDGYLSADSERSFNCGDLVDAQGNYLPGVVNADGNIDPSVSGSPMTEYGSIDLCGRYEFTYEDLKLPICGNAYKLVRTWTLLDWCAAGSGLVKHDQIIKVVDIEAPVISCPMDGDIEISSDPYTCTATWDVEPPLFVSDCGVEMVDPDFTIEYLLADANGAAPVNGLYEDANVVYNGGVPTQITGLPVGRTWLKYSVTDDCGNTGYCFTEIDVNDESDPFAVCLEHTVATLGPDGCVRVNAPSFDNGSWDNCGEVTFQARLCANNTTLTGYADWLDFCCADCGSTYCVDLLVTDEAGNTSSCSVDIDIIDNLPPVMTNNPPQTVEVPCTDGAITSADIQAAYASMFTVVDNCNTASNPVVVSPDSAEPAECGNNSVVFKWEISNSCGDPLVFNQTIIFTNPSVPVVTSWPADELNILECSTLPTPDVLASGYPVIANDDCSLLAVTHDDQTFENVDEACIKILRTWTVIDWCTYDANNPALGGISTHVQTIKIKDNEGPDITCPASFSINSNSGSCTVTTDDAGLILGATDACTDAVGVDLEYDYVVTSNGVTVASGSTNNANGSYPFGNFTITWTVRDHCDNTSTCTYNFSILDTKKPTPYCLGTVVTATMEDDLAVAIWASDFDLGGTDNYTGNCNNNPLNIFFLDDNGNPTPSLEFGCEDIPNGAQGTIFLEVWYEDEAGNRDFCEVVLLLQDNENDACDGALPRIAGKVRTEDFINVKDVDVEISSPNQPEYPDMMTTVANGDYEFVGIDMNEDYSIESERTDNVLNGVSTLDIVLIQKHILGLLQLNSAYKVIAADANNSGNITSIDLVEIRKVILGINAQYPNGQDSWRFVDAQQNFPSILTPFPYTEVISFTNISSSQVGRDFVAVKIGDVNNTAIVNLTEQNDVDNRSSETIRLAVNDRMMHAGTQVEVPVYAENFDAIVGYQMTLELDASVSFADVKSGALDMNENNFGFADEARGMITTSWNSSAAITADEDEVLFTLVLDVTDDIMVANAIGISSELTTAEIYDDGLTIMNLSLEARNNEFGAYELYQNVPNPFDNSTDISFSVPTESTIMLTVYDVNGRTIYTATNTYGAGKHVINLTENELNNITGVMYYQIETDGYVETKKMIRLK